MKVLFIGDVVGKVGRQAVYNLVPQIKKEEAINICIANAENAAGGMGITPKIAHQLFTYGVDIITMGNHIWRKNELLSTIDQISNFVRPANYPPAAPGKGWVIYPYPNYPLAVINIAGRVFMDSLDCPFRTIAHILEEELPKDIKNIIVDFHAEATSEKMAMGWYLAQRGVSAVVGTHTHIVTADERILLGHTAYITDVGMTGPFDSVIGIKKEIALNRFLTGLPSRFEVASKDIRLNAVVIDIEYTTGRALSIKRLEAKLDEKIQLEQSGLSSDDNE